MNQVEVIDKDKLADWFKYWLKGPVDEYQPGDGIESVVEVWMEGLYNGTLTVEVIREQILISSPYMRDELSSIFETGIGDHLNF